MKNISLDTAVEKILYINKIITFYNVK